MEACRPILIAGIKSLGIPVSEEQVTKLLAFVDLIAKWNKAYNLTAIKKPQDMVRLHLLDSLSVLPYLRGKSIIDVGTGAGLPGIPLAICLSGIRFTLLDSNAKKTRFVQQAVLELKLTNVTVVHHRVEDYTPDKLFDCLLTRAFAELAGIMTATRHLLAKDGKLIAMKGRNLEAEMAQVTLPKTVIALQIPGLDVERNLVCIENNHDKISAT